MLLQTVIAMCFAVQRLKKHLNGKFRKQLRDRMMQLQQASQRRRNQRACREEKHFNEKLCIFMEHSEVFNQNGDNKHLCVTYFDHLFLYQLHVDRDC